jgi:hypothetical protein
MTDTYLIQGNVDDLGRMVGALLSELWIMRDRMAVLEHLLDQQGIVTSAMVDQFDWPAEKAASIEALRDTVVSSVLGAPLGGRERHVDQMLARAGLARKTTA